MLRRTRAGSDAAYSAGPLSLTSEDDDGEEEDEEDEQVSASLSPSTEDDGSSSGDEASTPLSSPNPEASSQSAASHAVQQHQTPSEALATEVCKTLREQAHTGDDVMRLIKVRFESLDKARKGFINAEEFRQLLVAVLGGRDVASEDAATLLKRMHADTDHNGQVSYDEFVSFVSLDRATIAATARKLRTALLKRLRDDCDGSAVNLFARYCNAKHNAIYPQDFKALVHQVKVGAEVMTDGERQGLMGFLDHHGKGFIDISDFQLFLEPPANRKTQRSQTRKAKITTTNKSNVSDGSANDEYDAQENSDEDDGDDENNIHGQVEEESKADDRQVDNEKNDAVVVDLRLAILGSSKKRKDQEEALFSQGFTRLVSSLNGGGRGHRLHLFVRRANTSAFADEEAFMRARVTDITLSRSNKDATLLALGYQCVEPYSTSQGAWFARRQYLWVRRNAKDTNPILDLAVTAGRKRDLSSQLWTPPCRGFKRVDGDLNAGNRGAQVFLWYLKDHFQQDEGPYAQLARIVRSKLRRLAADNAIDVEALWDRYDRRDRGWLPRKHFYRLIARDLKLGLEARDIEQVVDLLDINRDGRIDREEFVDFIAFNPAQVQRILRTVATAQRKRDIDSRTALRRWLATSTAKDVAAPQRNARRRSATSASSASAMSSISPKDLARALKRVGVRLSAEDFKALMGRFDKHGVGLVDAKDLTDALWRTIRTLREANNASDDEGLASPSDPAAKTFVNVEVAARKLRAFARSLAGPDLDMGKACDALLGGRDKDRLSRDRVRQVLSKEFKLSLSDKEIAMLLLRTGTSRTKLIDFCTSSTYLDAVLNRIVDAALKVETRRFFRQLDAEGNGRLSRANFAAGLKALEVDGQRIQLSAKEVNQIVQRFDQDGDGAVDLEEFLHFIESADRARRAARDALLDEEERKLDDARVLYVFSALRKLHLVNHHSVDQLFAKFCTDHEQEESHTRGSGSPLARGFALDGLETGLRRLGLVPQEVQLSAAQFQQVFRRMDIANAGLVRKRHFARFLARGVPGAARTALVSPQLRVPHRLRATLVAHGRALQQAMHELDARGTGLVIESAFVQAVRRLGVSSREARGLARAFVSETTRDAIDYEALLAWVDHARRQRVRRGGSGDDSDGRFGDFSPSQSPRSDRRRGRQSRRRRRRVQSDDGDDIEDGTGSFFGSDSDGLDDQDLPAAVPVIRREYRAPARLMRALHEYCNPDGRLSRADVNEMLQDAGLPALSRRDWNDMAVRTSKELCNLVFAAGHGASPRGRHRPTDETDENDFDDPETAAEADLARDYVARCVKEAVLRGKFAWETAARRYDQDGSGCIRLRDLGRVLRACDCSLPPAKLRAVAHIMAALRDGGQRVNYEHFFAHLLQPRDAQHGGAMTASEFEAGVDGHDGTRMPTFEEVETKIRNAVRAEGFADGHDLDDELARLDHDGDGKVSATVLARALPRLLGGLELTPGELQTVIEHFDHDQSGRIDVSELAVLVELRDVDVDELVVRVKEELREQARMGTRLEENFAQADANGDGQLSRREFRKCLDQLLPPGRRLSNREVRRLMDRFDPARNGRVDYQAFCELCAPSEIEMLALEAKVRDKVRGVASRSRGGPVDLKKAFALFDAGGHGKVSRRDFQQACDRLGLALSENELELLLQRFDTNGSGAVDYFEFSRFIEYDGTEIEDLEVRAGRHLDALQRDQVDPVAAFEVLEGRRRPVGALPRHAFYRGCRDLEMPFGDTEISALADLFADGSSVRYRDFCLSTLARAGARYQGRLAAIAGGAHGGAPAKRLDRDEVWNPRNVEAWLSTQATVQQQRKFKHLQRAMAQACGGDVVAPLRDNLENEETAANVRLRSVLKPGSSFDPAPAAPKDRWDCPVCFYKQSRANRLTCEMCDSPCPTQEATAGGQWPYVKPIFDQAYRRVGATPAGVIMADPLPALELVPQNKHPRREPKWHIVSEWKDGIEVRKEQAVALRARQQKKLDEINARRRELRSKQLAGLGHANGHASGGGGIEDAGLGGNAASDAPNMP
ncbi:Calmodulin [Hondaea fermentalgiana]|uniref:Calmodulin n=1 Tax=Hondaea fermentalgiana TaxID=2315210 RepID=A0A2R5GX22_9STRA|nr:Calmodulin [Hondaea fermentalgiana]|eukprot:GBG34328.1 Calmodulin [Hondaea fermentalgiana]